MKWQQAYHRTKANKITIVTTSERDRKTCKPVFGYFKLQIESTTRGRNQASLEGYLIFFLILFTKGLAECTSN